MKTIKDRRAASPLIAALKDPDGSVRSEAAVALGVLGDVRAVEPLIAALAVSDLEVPAALSLGWIRDARAIQPLLAILKQQTDLDSDVIPRALGAIGEPVIEPLNALLKGTDARIRGRAIEALGHVENTQAADLLISGLRDPDFKVRATAARELGKTRTARSCDSLIAALRDPKPEVRREGAIALGAIGDARAIRPLLPLLEDPEVQVAAVSSLGAIGASALDPLVEAVAHRAPRVRIAAIEQLDRFRGLRTFKALVAALTDANSDVRDAADGALLRYGTNEFDSLCGALKDPEPRVRRRAASELVCCSENPLVIDPLAAALGDLNARVRLSAAVALEKVKDQRAEHALAAALDRGDLAVVAGAYSFFLRRGSFAEVSLIRALHAHGTEEMARTLLNSGIPKFRDAARAWARAHGYTVELRYKPLTPGIY